MRSYLAPGCLNRSWESRCGARFDRAGRGVGGAGRVYGAAGVGLGGGGGRGGVRGGGGRGADRAGRGAGDADPGVAGLAVMDSQSIANGLMTRFNAREVHWRPAQTLPDGKWFTAVTPDNPHWVILYYNGNEPLAEPLVTPERDVILLVSRKQWPRPIAGEWERTTVAETRELRLERARRISPNPSPAS